MTTNYKLTPKTLCCRVNKRHGLKESFHSCVRRWGCYKLLLKLGVVSNTAALAMALLKFGILGALFPLDDSAGLLLNLLSPKCIASEVNQKAMIRWGSGTTNQGERKREREWEKSQRANGNRVIKSRWETGVSCFYHSACISAAQEAGQFSPLWRLPGGEEQIRARRLCLRDRKARPSLTSLHLQCWFIQGGTGLTLAYPDPDHLYGFYIKLTLTCILSIQYISLIFITLILALRML